MKTTIHKKTLVKPFIYIIPSIRYTTIAMLCLLSVQLVMLIFTKSYNALLVVAVSCVGTALAMYILKLYYKKRKMYVLSAILQGILVGMLLPSNYPLLTVFFISFFAMLISKIMSINLPQSWYNFVALVVIVCWIIGMKEFPAVAISSDLVASPNPSLLLIQSGSIPMIKYDTAITDFLNRNIFSIFNVTIPEGYVSMLWDNNSIIPAFRFNLITLASSVVLVAVDMITMFIPMIFLVTYGILIRLFMPVFFGGSIGQGDMILAFTTGGTFFCMVYLLQWFGTVPSTTAGKAAYAFLCGITAFFVVGYGMSPVGMVFTIFVANIISSIIQGIEEKRNLAKTYQLLHEERYLNG